MSLNITASQVPSAYSPILAQSPIVFSVFSSANASSSFYYTLDLRIWSGSRFDSGSAPRYSLIKYPNALGYGIFDISRFANSSLTNLALQATSSALWYTTTFNYNYQGGISGSDITLRAPIDPLIDGYQLFPEAINQNVSSSTFYPLLTSGPSTQSVLITDVGWGGIVTYMPGSEAGDGPNVSGSVDISYTGSYADGSTTLARKSMTIPSSSFNTSASISWYPTAPQQPGFPLALTNNGYDLTSYSIRGGRQIVASPLRRVIGAEIKYNIVCPQYYDPIRIFWKNRFSQFDWLNFYLKSTETFDTVQRVYQPQLGTWNSSTLTYTGYQSATQRYIVDALQTITVNTGYLPESYNEIMKQLLVTDEAYWMYDQPQNLVKPLTIKTNNLTFKTGVNDKLIQYTIAFDIGQPYKLII